MAEQNRACIFRIKKISHFTYWFFPGNYFQLEKLELGLLACIFKLMHLFCMLHMKRMLSSHELHLEQVLPPLSFVIFFDTVKAPRR